MHWCLERVSTSFRVTCHSLWPLASAVPLATTLQGGVLQPWQHNGEAAAPTAADFCCETKWAVSEEGQTVKIYSTFWVNVCLQRVVEGPWRSRGMVNRQKLIKWNGARGKFGYFGAGVSSRWKGGLIGSSVDWVWRRAGTGTPHPPTPHPHHTSSIFSVFASGLWCWWSVCQFVCLVHHRKHPSWWTLYRMIWSGDCF